LWLPQAISAPTPISALVHSSTLVTAGVVVFFKFYAEAVAAGLGFYIFFLRGRSLLFRGAKRVLEKDVKKIVAFSTLRQLSLIFLVGTVGFKILMLFHLICHARFKFILFLRVGGLILLNWGLQDFRKKNQKKNVVFL